MNAHEVSVSTILRNRQDVFDWDSYCYYQYDVWDPDPTPEEQKALALYSLQDRLELSGKRRPRLHKWKYEWC